jgi:hypothetical protein
MCQELLVFCIEVGQKEKIMWDKHSCLSFFANIGQARMPIPPISVILRQPHSQASGCRGFWFYVMLPLQTSQGFGRLRKSRFPQILE